MKLGENVLHEAPFASLVDLYMVLPTSLHWSPVPPRPTPAPPGVMTVHYKRHLVG